MTSLQLILMFYAGGILLRHVLPPIFFWIGGLFVALGLWLGFRRPSYSGSYLLVVLVLLGGGVYEYRLWALEGGLREHVGERVTIQGTIVRPADPGDSRGSHVLQVERVLSGDGFRLAGGCVELLMGDGIPPWEHGDRLRVTGVLRVPRVATNPGGFDYSWYLARHGVGYQMYVVPGQLELVGSSTGILRGIHALRSRLIEVMHSTLPPGEAPVLSGIVLGARSSLPPEVRDDFLKAGVFHVLAVSGSNVAFVSTAAMQLAGIAGAAPRSSRLIALGSILGYVLVTGASASVVRAGIMGGAALVAPLLGRKASSLNSMALAALFILLANPLQLFDGGFQLSFGAALGIICLNRRIERHLGFLPSFLRPLLSVTIAAQLAVLPLLLWYFNGLSLVSLVANLFVVPASGLLVITGLAGSLGGLVSLKLAGAVNLFNGAVLGLMLISLDALSDLPFSFLYVRSTGPVAVLGYYAALFWAFGRNHAHASKRILIAALLGACWLVWTGLPGASSGRLTAVFFDVGQGDSTLILAPGGRSMLVDAGGTGAGGGSGLDAGSRVIVPYLKRRGIHALDLLVLSHPHDDHIGGALAVMEGVRVRGILAPGSHHQPGPRPSVAREHDRGDAGESPLMEEISKRARAKGIPYFRGYRGQRFALGDALMEVLHPPPGGLAGTGSDPNNNSLVLRLSYKGISLLFTGDMEEEGERQLLDTASDLSSTVLKVAHHGSDSSSAAAFLRRVSPRWAVIQVGANPHGLPGERALHRLDEVGAAVLRTDRHGAVTLTSDGSRTKLATTLGEGRSPAPVYLSKWWRDAYLQSIPHRQDKHL